MFRSTRHAVTPSADKGELLGPTPDIDVMVVLFLSSLSAPKNRVLQLCATLGSLNMLHCVHCYLLRACKMPGIVLRLDPLPKDPPRAVTPTLQISACGWHSSRVDPRTWGSPQVTFQWLYSDSTAAIRRAPCPEKSNKPECRCQKRGPVKEDEDPKGNHHCPSQREEPQLYSQSILGLFTVADERRDTPRAVMERRAKTQKGETCRKGPAGWLPGSGSAVSELCDLKKVRRPLWASASASIKQAEGGWVTH